MTEYKENMKMELVMPSRKIETVRAMTSENPNEYLALHKGRSFIIKDEGNAISYQRMTEDGPKEYFRIEDLTNQFIPGFDMTKPLKKLKKVNEPLFREIITKFVGNILDNEEAVEISQKYLGQRSDLINEMRMGNAGEKMAFLRFYDFLVENEYIVAPEKEKKLPVKLDQETAQFIFEGYAYYEAVKCTKEIVLRKLKDKAEEKLQRKMTWDEGQALEKNYLSIVPIKFLNRTINSMGYGFLGEQIIYREFRDLVSALDQVKDKTAVDLADDQLSQLERRVKSRI